MEEKVVSAFPWDQVILKLLDWPFLFFVFCSVLAWLMRSQIAAVIDRSNIKITWGDRSIELSELADSVDKDIDPLKEKILDLEKRLDELKPEENDQPEKFEALSDGEARIYNALNSEKFKYRTATGIAQETGMSVASVYRIIAKDPKIVEAHSRDGKKVYRLSSNKRL